MKKIVLALTLVAFIAVGFSSSAVAVTTSNKIVTVDDPPCKKTCNKKDAKTCADKKAGKTCDKKCSEACKEKKTK
jgi:hypothetical protein